MLEFDDFFLNDLELEREFVSCFKAVLLGGFIVEVLDRGLDFHHLKGDLFTGLGDLQTGVFGSHRGEIWDEMREIARKGRDGTFTNAPCA